MTYFLALFWMKLTYLSTPLLQPNLCFLSAHIWQMKDKTFTHPWDIYYVISLVFICNALLFSNLFCFLILAHSMIHLYNFTNKFPSLKWKNIHIVWGIIWKNRWNSALIRKCMEFASKCAGVNWFHYNAVLVAF